MEYTELGGTGMRVSRICFGTWQFGGEWGSLEERENVAAMRRALELGINFFDTAQAYGFGASEELVGKALADQLRGRRDELVIATKGGLRPDGDDLLRDSGREWLRRGVEDSLRFLGTEYIDLYQVHWPDPDTPFAETAATLDELVEEGKIRHVGVSNYDAEQMAEFARVRPVETLQPPYHLFNREVEASVLPWCREHEVGVLAYGPLAHGLLTGKFDDDAEFAADDWRSSSPMFSGEAFHSNLEKVRDLGRFAEERGHTVTEVAIAWVLANPAVDVAIVGARSPDQIEGSAPAADLRLSDGDLQEIDRIMEGAVTAAGPSPEG